MNVLAVTNFCRRASSDEPSWIYPSYLYELDRLAAPSADPREFLRLSAFLRFP